MSTVTPPPPPNPPTGSAPLPVVVVREPPPALLSLPLGTAIEAVVMASKEGKTLQLQSPIGPLTLLSRLPLPPNTSLTLVLDQTTPRSLVHIATIDGKPVSAQLLGQLAPSARAAQAGQATPPLTVDPGQSVKATVLRPIKVLPSSPTSPVQTSSVARGMAARSGPSQTATPLTQAPSPSPASTTTPARAQTTTPAPVQTTTPPSTQTTTPPSTQTTTSPAPEAAGAARNLPMTPSENPPTPAAARIQTGQSGTGLGRTAQAPQAGAQAPQAGTMPQSGPGASAPTSPPAGASAPENPPAGAPASAPPPPATGQAASTTTATATPPSTQTPTPAGTDRVLIGSVAGRSSANHLLVQTAKGMVSLETPLDPPKGSILRMELDGLPMPVARARAGAMAKLQQLMTSWPSLKESITQLSQSDPAIAQNLIETVMPRPDAQLGPRLLFFMAALRLGDIRMWAGPEALRVLGERRLELAERLGEDFRVLGRTQAATPQGDWRIYAAPLYDGGALSQIRLLVRDHPDKGDDDDPEQEKSKDRRFIVEVTLSRLGRLQLDGLVAAKKGRFDLIFRSERPLNAETRDAIHALFRDSAEITGLKGGVTFRYGAQFIDVPDSMIVARDDNYTG